MLYNPLLESIPSEKRKFFNDKCFAIAAGIATPGTVSKEQIYQAFTGKGGLHDLSRNDYENYAHFSDDKKEKEMGQFFTPDSICQQIVEMFSIAQDDLVCDPTCGKGSFLNYVPNIANAYGNELDNESYKIANYLFDKATITNDDICYYNPKVQFDFIFGNPPFNLRLEYKGETKNSQAIFFDKCAELLVPGGFVAAIVPGSFLNDGFLNKSLIENINLSFGFVGQMMLKKDAFKALGVKQFDTKIMVFQRKVNGIEFPFFDNSYVRNLLPDIKHAEAIKAKSTLEIRKTMVNSSDGLFDEKVKKYLYEIKAHPVLKSDLKKALSKINELHTQQKPDSMSGKEWEKRKLTSKKVLTFLKKMVCSQESNLRPAKKRDIIKLVKTNYGLKLKAYSGKAKARLNSMDISKVGDWATLCNNPALATAMTKYSETKSDSIMKVFFRKYNEFKKETTWFDHISVSDQLNEWLTNYVCQDKKGYDCKLKPIQHEDLGLALSKRFSLLNWQQGSGKSIGGLAALRYNREHKPNIKYSFLIGPPIATKMTWAKLLTMNNEKFVFVKSIADLQNVEEGSIILMSLTTVKKYERELVKFMKIISYKAQLLFDESDEISNVHSQQRKSVKKVFRKLKYKMLTTGTATRNNISELYPQLELMYNNSQNLLSKADYVYREEKVKKLVFSSNGSSKEQSTGEVIIHDRLNKYINRPFPAYAGHTHFMECFNPSKSTVFGIGKQNQDIYNSDVLSSIANQAILTRSFKDIVGPDRYEIESRKVSMSSDELDLYQTLLTDFYSIVNEHFESTGDSRKDSQLRIIRQIKLLIKACSTPQVFSQYSGDSINSKMRLIIDDVKKANQATIIGTTSIEAVNRYYNVLKQEVKGRAIFMVSGDVSFKKRQDIITAFESFDNAIIICTQQSLSSSVDIPTCNLVLCESMQWNFPRMEQFYFRAIRLTSKLKTKVVMYNYANSIEQNILGLLLAKEALNEFIKTRAEANQDALFAEFGVANSLFDELISKVYDDEGVMTLSWGTQKLTA